MTVLDLKRLRVFQEVARQRSFSAAAQALDYSQPAISHHVSRLELELGVRLLRRERSGVTVTPAGEVLLEHARALLERSAEAEAHVARVADEPDREIRVAAFATASATLVADAVVALRDHPHPVAMRLVEGDPGDAVAALRLRHVDVAIAFDDPQHPLAFEDDIVAEHLLDDPMWLALPRDHPLAGEDGIEIGRLRDQEWIQGAGEETPASLILMAACLAAGFEPRVAFNTGNFGVVQELVANRIGVALVPALAFVRGHAGVVARPLLPETPARRIWMLHRWADGAEPHEAAMLEALREAAARRRELPMPGPAA